MGRYISPEITRLVDEFGNYITSDVDRSAIIITNEHEKVHDGELFQVSLFNNSLTSGSTAYCQIKTGNSIVHLKQKNISTDNHEFTCTFTESPTLTDGTTPITIINRNRNSSNTPDVVFYSDPTGISGGTLLSTDYYPGSLLSPGGLVASELEWNLKANTSYIHALTNLSGTTATFGAKLLFYEI